MTTAVIVAACGWAAGLAGYGALSGQALSGQALSAPAQIAPGDASRCDALARIALPDTEIVTAVFQSENLPVSSASYTAADRSKVGAPISGLPAFCRIAGRIHPEPGSDIRFEAWLPTERWNGRYMGVGNGGFAGSIRFKEMGETISAGYATASTDTGHDERVTPMATWAPGNPVKVRDYGWRAVHLTTAVAKRLVAAFYGRPADKSYFQSCSNGGRQGLMEAARFPDDFDGILAGAPAAEMTTAVMSHVWSQQAQSKPGAAFRPEQMKFLQNEVLRQCDALDGRTDNLIDDPRTCKVNTAKLSCANSKSPLCFSAAQVQALNRLYAGPTKRAGKAPAFAFPASGAEAGRPVPFLGWDGFIAAGGERPPQQVGLALGMIRDMLSPSISSIDAFDWTRDPALLTAKLGPDINVPPNLEKFFARGGKLIIYHGWADAAIPPAQTIALRKAILKRSGPRAGQSMRLFMIPGMQHCFGGTGSEIFGEMTGADDKAQAETNISMALRQWVEHGRVPESVIGTSSPAPGQTENFRPISRLHCVYPKQASLKRGADPASPLNYTCR
ncbi:tannase/feruloyl esterase family alpha/beta hydrolase [Novosphingobium colocasiae]|nr:tannase/feruloyl esterase family alpha/beta hydrolase [Novosphingobium colocasiae]